MSLRNISEILTQVSSILKKSTTLTSIILKADVIQIKEWNAMAFLEIADESGSISAIIKSYKNKIKVSDAIKISGNIESYRGKVQLNIVTYEKIGGSKNVDNLNQIISELDKLNCIHDKKKELPSNIKNIGIISSKNAAGLRDFLHIVNSKSGFNIYLYEASVQGNSAPKEIISAIKSANKHNVCDILCIIRGGGSKDDLSCFNDKKLAIKIHESGIPTLSGIGHEIDKCIVDLVVDKSFITPSAVAQFIIGYDLHSNNLIKQFDALKYNLMTRINQVYSYINSNKLHLEKLYDEINNKINAINAKYSNNLDKLKRKLYDDVNLFMSYIINCKNELHICQKNIVDELDDILLSYKNINSIDDGSIKNKIMQYESKLSKMSTPKIYDENKNIIMTCEQFNCAKKIFIEFVDGLVTL